MKFQMYVLVMLLTPLPFIFHHWSEFIKYLFSINNVKLFSKPVRNELANFIHDNPYTSHFTTSKYN